VCACYFLILRAFVVSEQRADLACFCSSLQAWRLKLVEIMPPNSFEIDWPYARNKPVFSKTSKFEKNAQYSQGFFYCLHACMCTSSILNMSNLKKFLWNINLFLQCRGKIFQAPVEQKLDITSNKQQKELRTNLIFDSPSTG